MTPSTRILVVEDDPDALLVLRHHLDPRPDYEATYCSSAATAAEHLTRGRWDVLATDLHMPGMDGLQLAALARQRDARLPVLLITAHATVDAAVRAVKGAVTDFLTKPLQRDAVLQAIDSAVAHRRAQGRRVLAVGAHPDDVEIGAGATLAGHVRAGDHLTILTTSSGRRGGDAGLRAAEAQEAATRLGGTLVLGDLEDTAIPDRGPTIDLIEGVCADVQPDTIYVHSAHDLHQDHRAVHAATLVAARGVQRVLCYQSPSATIDFRPTMFVPVGTGMDAKLEAIAAFATQTSIRDYLEPDMLTATARYWGRFARTRFAEPFEVVRESQGVDRVAV
ncbi:MAG TPA: response regulator [Ornithinimicrobium sp.]|uniref:response regulator n=1 Tax=Ornithinimicrobium sp. TaxID=1977084 RepID=UPI002B4A8321|nr:response regulator [Ornithinimicrobium sp.]HKJ11031.1 response regulator [Ornithinimicrobium sp.]